MLANKISKLITWFTLILFFVTAEYMELSGYATAAVGTTLWFWLPDAVVYLLESHFNIKHDHTSYR